MEDKLKKVGSMKDCVVAMCRKLNAESSSLCSLTLQPKDLEEYLDCLKKDIEDRYEEVTVLEREVEGRCKEVELKESEMSLVKRKIEEYELKVIKMEGKISSLEKVIEERSNACEVKERRLNLARQVLEGCSFNALAKELMTSPEECSSVFMRKEFELVNKRVIERREELVLKQKKETLLEELLQKISKILDLKIEKWRLVQEHCCGELELKSERLVSVEKTLEESEKSLMLKRQELGLLEKSIEACSSEFHRKEKELVGVKKWVDERVKDIHAVPNQSTTDGPNLSQPYSQSPQVEKRDKGVC